MTYTPILSIAGSDSIGGAGIQADIKTCCALDCYAMTAITAVTAQSTRGVDSYQAVAPELLEAQLRAVCTDVRPAAVKIGMIPDAASAQVIADAIERYSLAPVVLDPVMVATSGHSLSDSTSAHFLMRLLMPLATVVTPNLPEAETLLGHAITDAEEAAQELLRICRGAAVLLKGGHGPDLTLIDVLATPGETRAYAHRKIDTPNTHGTGCSLSSAIACHLAQGMSVDQACEAAIDWLHSAIASGARYSIGHGHGPVDHNWARHHLS